MSLENFSPSSHPHNLGEEWMNTTQHCAMSELGVEDKCCVEHKPQTEHSGRANTQTQSCFKGDLTQVQRHTQTQRTRRSIRQDTGAETHIGKDTQTRRHSTTGMRYRCSSEMEVILRYKPLTLLTLFTKFTLFVHCLHCLRFTLNLFHKKDSPCESIL